MRIATALVFTALVCATQAQGSFPGLSGLFGHSSEDRIKELRQIIDERLQQAEERLQSSYKQAREQIEGAYKRVEDAAQSVRNRVKEAVDNVQDNVQKQVDQLAQNAAGEGVDVSTCTALVQSFRDAVDTVVSDVGSCVTSKVQKGKDLTADVLNKGQESLDVITSIRSQSNECVENVEGISEQLSAVACLVKVGTKSSWALSTKVPVVAKDYTEAVALVSTLPTTLSYCMTKNSIMALTKQGRIIVADVRKCVSNRIAAAQDSKIKVPEVPVSPLPIPEVSPTTPSSGLVLPGFEEVPQNEA